MLLNILFLISIYADPEYKLTICSRDHWRKMRIILITSREKFICMATQMCSFKVSRKLRYVDLLYIAVAYSLD